LSCGTSFDLIFRKIGFGITQEVGKLRYATQENMREYQGLQFQVDIRIDGKYYCRIYQFGIPDAFATTDDYAEEKMQ
jgi:hypothetical protein